MKKALVLTGFLVAVLSLSVFAGPLVGLSFAPAADQAVSVHFGWQSQNSWAMFVTKDNLNNWKGNWGIGAIWTPRLWDSVSLRAGGDINLRWNNTIVYKGLDLRIGSEWWLTNQFGVWGEIRIAPNLSLYPIVGFDLNFWMPSAQEPQG